MSDPEIDQLKKDIHFETYFSFLYQNVGVRLRHIFSSQFFKQSLFKQHCKEDKYRTQSKIHFFMIKDTFFLHKVTISDTCFETHLSLISNFFKTTRGHFFVGFLDTKEIVLLYLLEKKTICLFLVWTKAWLSFACRNTSCKMT